MSDSSAIEIAFDYGTKAMVDCMSMHAVFFLLSGHLSVFLYFSYTMAVDFQGNSLTVTSVFSEVERFEGSVPIFKPSVLKTAL